MLIPNSTDGRQMKTQFSRRDLFKTTAAAAAAACVPRTSVETAHASSATAPTTRRPNVLMIVLDDLGSIDLNCYGSADLATPNLDAIAAAGARFTQFYGAGPICSPSRVAVMSGRYPLRVGITSNIGSEPGAVGLPPAERTLADTFKAAGYATGHVGKWHLGYTPPTMPTRRGFNTSFGNMGGCIDNYSHFFYWSGPDRHDLWQDDREVWREGRYYGDLMVDACHAFIERATDGPFFLYWAINQPHYPLQGLAHWRDHYRRAPAPRSMYAASVSTLDELVGRVMGRLRELNLDRQTIVAVQSDHGHSTEDRAFGGGGSAGPYRGAKFSLFEGGIRVVSLVAWPGTLPAGIAPRQLATGCDWMPTLAELAGVKLLPSEVIDGRSLVPIIHSPQAATPHEVFHWTFEEQWAVREGGWKLIANPRDTTAGAAPRRPTDKLFLSDISQNPSEQINRADEHPDVVRRLSGLHEQWVRETSSPARKPAPSHEHKQG